MLNAKELIPILQQCDADMPIILEVEKGVFVELKGLVMEDTDQEYRVVLSAFPANE